MDYNSLHKHCIITELNYTDLIHSCYYHDFRTIKAILHHNTYINIDFWNSYILRWAIDHTNHYIVLLLLRYGATTNNRTVKHATFKNPDKLIKKIISDYSKGCGKMSNYSYQKRTSEQITNETIY